MKRWTVLLVLLLLVPVWAGAASYEIVENVMDVTVAPDGVGLFEETLVYEFDGAYNGIIVTIRHEGVQLMGLHVFVDGDTELEWVGAMDKVPYTFTAVTKGNETEIVAYAPGGTGQRVFALSYQMGGLAQRYQDTARVNHVFFNSAQALPNATLRLTLPGDEDAQIIPFAHGAAGSEDISLSGGVVTVGPKRVAADTMLELDVLFPAAWLPDARVIGLDVREEALAVEAQIAADIAEEAARQEALARQMVIILLGLLGVYAVGALLIFTRMARKYGLNHRIEPITDEGLLRDMDAAQAQVFAEGAVSASGFSATLLELVERNVLTVQTDAVDTLFIRREGHPPLQGHTKLFVDWLFRIRPELSLASLDAGESVDAAKYFNERYNAWKTQVKEDMRERGWLHRNDSQRVVSLLCVLVLGLALAGFLLRFGLWPLAVLSGVLAVVLAVAFGRIRKLTDAGERQLAAIEGFRLNYEDKLAENPQSVLGHTPLVMALGYMEPVAQWLDEHYPEADYATWDGLAPYWAYDGWHHHMLHMNEKVREVQSHNAGVQSSGDSDSGSSSGGFSGGSGGGNSYGAW